MATPGVSRPKTSRRTDGAHPRAGIEDDGVSVVERGQGGFHASRHETASRLGLLVQLQRGLPVGDGEAVFFDRNDVVSSGGERHRKQAAAGAQVDDA